VALCIWGALLILWEEPPSLPELTVGICLAGLWLVPARAVARDRAVRQIMLAPLPFPARRRSGRDRLLTVLLICPPALLAVGVWLRWSLLP
jgi:hypothetical protein